MDGKALAGAALLACEVVLSELAASEGVCGDLRSVDSIEDRVYCTLLCVETKEIVSTFTGSLFLVVSAGFPEDAGPVPRLLSTAIGQISVKFRSLLPIWMLAMSIVINTQGKPGRLLGQSASSIRVAEVISALSFALDLTEGQPMGHSVRTSVLGMRLAEEIGLPPGVRGDLYYALLMKDAGCSTNASRMFQILGNDDIKAKRDVKTIDWTGIGWESLHYALSHVM
jgi:hypothetical protein